MKPLSYMDFRDLYAVAIKNSVFLRKKTPDFRQIFGICCLWKRIVGELSSELVQGLFITNDLFLTRRRFTPVTIALLDAISDTSRIYIKAT